MTRDFFQTRRQIGTKMKAFLRLRNVSYDNVEDDFEKLKKLYEKEQKKLLKEMEKAQEIQAVYTLIKIKHHS
jgi:hypothetical protein